FGMTTLFQLWKCCNDKYSYSNCFIYWFGTAFIFLDIDAEKKLAKDFWRKFFSRYFSSYIIVECISIFKYRFEY
ncbi:MAG: hypothetical protein AB8B80_10395, partial [Marinicellaceae bacterium]